MKFGVVGDPVEHSRSPAIHNAAYAALGIDAVYVLLETPTDAFASIVGRLRSGDLDGVNVTMPHKGNAYDAVDHHTEGALRTGAVNTITVTQEGLVGTNTDIAGVRHAFDVADPDDAAPVLVLGAGGAASAALVATEQRDLFVSARSTGAADAARARTNVTGNIVPWGDPVPGAVVVNATPLGMHGEHLPPAVIEAASGLIDMTYGASPSPGISLAVARGLPHADGLDMLIGQAIEAFTIFTGIEAPTQVIIEAARRS